MIQHDKTVLTFVGVLTLLLITPSLTAMQYKPKKNKRPATSSAVSAHTIAETAAPQIITQVPYSTATHESTEPMQESNTPADSTPALSVQTEQCEPSYNEMNEYAEISPADMALAALTLDKTEQSTVTSASVSAPVIQPQYPRGTLREEVEKAGTWFRFSSRAVRALAMDVVTTYDPQKNILGTGDTLENSSFFSAAVASWSRHRTQEDIQQCMAFLTCCKEKHINLDKTICEAARDFLNEVRKEWEKNAKGQLTAAEQNAQSSLAAQIEAVQKLYDQQQKTVGDILTAEHTRLLEIRMAIAAASQLCNGAKIGDKAPAIIEYANETALLKHFDLKHPQLVSNQQVQRLQDIAEHPLLLEPASKK